MKDEENPEQFKQAVKLARRKARTTATVFGALAVVALIAVVYAFLQNAATAKAMYFAEQSMIESRECAKRAEKAELEAHKAQRMAEEQTEIAREMAIKMEKILKETEMAIKKSPGQKSSEVKSAK